MVTLRVDEDEMEGFYGMGEGSPRSVSTGVEYLRKSFVGIANMAAYELALNDRYGIAAYINGVEVYRDNLLLDTCHGILLHSRDSPYSATWSECGCRLAIEVHFTTTVHSGFCCVASYVRPICSECTVLSIRI